MYSSCKDAAGHLSGCCFFVQGGTNMEAARIFIAMSSEVAAGKLRAVLTENGYIVIDTARDGHDCLRKIRTLRPDITLLDYDLPSANGYEVSKVAIEDSVSDVILIGTEMQKSYIEDIMPECGFVFMEKPLNKTNLISTIELMNKSRKKIRQLEKQLNDLKSTLDTRKEVEKAKGLLMKYLHLSEDEAFKKIQKQSMDKGIAMKEIAKAIILAYDI